jgi:hypothetical protein
MRPSIFTQLSLLAACLLSSSFDTEDGGGTFGRLLPGYMKLLLFMKIIESKHMWGKHDIIQTKGLGD